MRVDSRVHSELVRSRERVVGVSLNVYDVRIETSIVTSSVFNGGKKTRAARNIQRKQERNEIVDDR